MYALNTKESRFNFILSREGEDYKEMREEKRERKRERERERERERDMCKAGKLTRDLKA
jgi:hypothetical protein